MQKSFRKALASLCAAALAIPATPAFAQASVAGFTPSSFRVTESGAAEYRIPIQVPPGVAGMEPKLALVYNSQAGNGLLATGWNLEGLSSITRCPGTIMQDGFRGGISYGPNDRYCLDGQRLIMISGASYGANAAEYRTERETFTRVISYGVAGNGPAYFRAWTKSGQILEYGNTGDSAIEAQGKPTVRVWALNKVSDTKGNYITLTYVENNATGEYRPDTIRYTQTAVPSSTANVVQFNYATRTDVVRAYEGGSLIQVMHRLTALQACAEIAETDPCTNTHPNRTHSYQINYDNGGSVGASRVTSISQCGATASCLSPATFAWPAPTDGLFSAQANSFTGWSFSKPVQFQLITGDFDGDGRTDYMQAGGNYQYVFLSNGDGTFRQQGNLVPNGWNFGLPSSWQLIIGDFNGDGKTDYIEAGDNLQYVFLSNGDGTFSAQANSFTGWSFSKPVQFQLITGDFDGDGTTDYMEAGGNYQYVFLSNSNGTFRQQGNLIPNGWNFGLPSSYQLIIGDFNGDGKTDYIEAGNDRQYVFLSNGDGTFSARENVVSGWSFSMPVQFQLITGDFNGDGKTDYMEAGNNYQYVFLSNGDGTFAQQGNLIPNGWSFSMPVQFQLITGDFNGDGKTDYMEAGNNYQYVFLSNGDGTFTAQGNLIPNGWSFGLPSSYELVIGDFNGNGKTDYIEAGDNFQYVFLSNGGPSSTLLTATSSLGAATNITYKTLPENNGVYTKDSSAVYPKIDIQAPMYVVSSVQQGNGVGGTMTGTYAYGGLKAELGTGRGLLGFRWMDSTQQEAQVKTHTEYRQDWPYLGFPSLVKTTQSSGAALGQATNSFRCINSVSGADSTTGDVCSAAAGAPYFPYVSQSLQVSNDLNGAAFPTVTTINTGVDKHGNIGNVTVTTSDGYTKATTNIYTDDEAHWFLGRLTHSTVQSTTP